MACESRRFIWQPCVMMWNRGAVFIAIPTECTPASGGRPADKRFTWVRAVQGFLRR